MSRNIILLSDGTGNSSISAQKSNVWRLFEALDLGPDGHGKFRQIAFYDDGVGTSGFKPWRVLTGGFGWGLSRNVRELYRKLCRHYRPGDRIYLFGFSRGAFTVRVLVSFIASCGILDQSKPAPGKPQIRMDTDEGLRRGTKQAYKSYRRGYWDRAWWPQWIAAKVFRFIRKRLLRREILPPAEFRAAYSLPKPSGEQKQIEFIGVFDTVDAVGLPVRELTTVIDRFIRPYKFPNQVLSEDVGRACQALAIDDERQTFYPLLWDELPETTPGRIKQVWFVGMHSNVGGGYPEDGLAHISLRWMIDEVKTLTDAAGKVVREGLTFSAGAMRAIQDKAAPLARLYDSRRGAGSYYRYMPRNITELTNQGHGHESARNRVRVQQPKIHHTVFDRIADARVGYAPFALPGDYQVVDKNGDVVGPAPGDPYYESPAEQIERMKMLDRAKNHIYWRRVIYFCLLFVTYFLVLMPHYDPPIPGWVPEGRLAFFWSFVFTRLSGFIPAFTRPWTDAWTQSPIAFTILVVLFVGTFAWSYWVVANTQRITEAGWWLWKGNTSPRYSRAPRLGERVGGWIRSTRIGRYAPVVFSRFVLPVGFFVLGIWLVVAGLYRGAIHYPFMLDGVCSRLEASEPVAGGKSILHKGSAEITFATADPCFNTHFQLTAGTKYHVSIAGTSNWGGVLERSRLLDPLCRRDDEDSLWRDNTVPASPKGLNCLWTRFAPAFLLGIPARRHLWSPWFTLTAEIGRDSGVTFPINMPEFDFVAPARGTLYLYVNDAINVRKWPIPNCPVDRQEGAACPTNSDWDAFYRNNKGIGSLTITEVSS